MKNLLLLSVILGVQANAMAACPQLAGVYRANDPPDGGTHLPSQIRVSQNGCNSLTFLEDGLVILTAKVDGSAQPTANGYLKYEWKGQSLVVTAVTEAGQVIPGWQSTYSLTASGDLLYHPHPPGDPRKDSGLHPLPESRVLGLTINDGA